MLPHSNSGREGSPSIKLVLGYEGSGHVKRELREREEGFKCGFTEAQWHELYLQAVIFKYIQSGLSVPLHLVLPIWRSLSSSNSSEIFTIFPRFELQLNSWGLGDMRMVDAEPGRCRRTDGKKWRCSKSVVPNQKYCERHMHRGSNRSRKLVEASKSDKHHKASMSMPLTLLEPKCLSSSTPKAASATSIASQEDGLFCANKTNQMNSRQSYVFIPGHGISRKIALQHGAGAEVELRCRRSDGKKWQCKRATVPEHKYCEIHLHRGVKKMTPSSNPVTVALPPPMDDRNCPPLAIATRYIDEVTSLDTNLSIAAPASHSSSSDSTTVTDETPMLVVH